MKVETSHVENPRSVAGDQTPTLQERARDAVANHLGVDASQVVVGSVTARTFSSALLGLPRGGAGAAVMVPGYVIQAKVSGRPFTLHAKDDFSVVKTANPPVMRSGPDNASRVG
ncbi:MAG: hypothetical protein AAFZ38_09275 [Myxococcota bacterium]